MAGGWLVMEGSGEKAWSVERGEEEDDPVSGPWARSSSGPLRAFDDNLQTITEAVPNHTRGRCNGDMLRSPE
jgi:hypothetical protein